MHSQGEDFLVNDGLGLLTPLNHQRACSVPVEFCDSTEQGKEVFTIDGVEFGDEASINENELGLVGFLAQFCQLGFPGFRVIKVGTEAVKGGFSHIVGIGGWRWGWRLASEWAGKQGEEIDFFRFIESDHNVTRVEVRMDEII